MKSFKFFLVSFLATAIFLFPSCGDDDATPSETTVDVTGTVVDDLGATLEGATVTSGADNTKTTTTAADGTFSITVEEADELTVSLDGYSSAMVTAAATVNVTLARGAGALFAESFATNNNSVVDPAFGANSIAPSGDLGALANFPAGFESVNYKGAIDPAGNPWYLGWSFYDNLINGDQASDPFTLGAIEVWNDATMAAAGDVVNWTNDKTYVLEGFVFVNANQTLNIQNGTVIQGKPGEGANASALIIARDGTINANGTADSPIIFTYEGDTGGTSAQTRGLWGGLIVLGNAELNSTPGVSAIEGIPTNEDRGKYGGSDNEDNSGVIRYVSIRHGGTNIGADNEINGLTLGGVGTGTSIDFVEIIGNKDDGIEWFGGTVNATHLISAFCADDALDYDEGYRGKNQFVIVHQDSAADAADRGGEHDGGTDPETAQPYATPEFFNVTSIGNSGSRTLTFRDNAGGHYSNSIFVDYGRGIDIEDLTDQDQDSYKQWQDGILSFNNNVFWNIGAGNAARNIFTVSN